MQAKQFIFLFSTLLISQTIFSSSQGATSAITLQGAHDQRILQLEIAQCSLRVATQDLKSEIQKLTTAIAQGELVQSHTTKILQETRTELREFKEQRNTRDQQVALEPAQLDELKARVQALTTSTENNFNTLNISLIGLLLQIQDQKQSITSMQEHLHAMHESRQRLETRLEEQDFITEGRLRDLHTRLCMIEAWHAQQ